MRKTKYTVKLTAQFRKDYKRAQKRGLNMTLLDEVVSCLAMGEPLPGQCRDHSLSGVWAGCRECHVRPDWLLIYRLEEQALVLVLTRTGTHSDLFDQ